MTTTAPRPRYYLVEWYFPEVNEEAVAATAARLDEVATSMSAAGSPVQLLMTLAVPSDEVVFGLRNGSPTPSTRRSRGSSNGRHPISGTVTSP